MTLTITDKLDPNKRHTVSLVHDAGDGKYRWYDEGDADTEVSGDTPEAALQAAYAAWERGWEIERAADMQQVRFCGMNKEMPGVHPDERNEYREFDFADEDVEVKIEARARELFHLWPGQVEIEVSTKRGREHPPKYFSREAATRCTCQLCGGCTYEAATTDDNGKAVCWDCVEYACDADGQPDACGRCEGVDFDYSNDGTPISGTLHHTDNDDDDDDDGDDDDEAEAEDEDEGYYDDDDPDFGIDGDFAQASSPIHYTTDHGESWDTSVFQVADFRHDPEAALAGVKEWLDSQAG